MVNSNQVIPRTSVKPGGRSARAMPEIGEADEEMEAARSNNVSIAEMMNSGQG
jgi:hypothetical protein